MIVKNFHNRASALYTADKKPVRRTPSNPVTGALLTVLLLVVVSGFISGMITRQANQSARELLGNAYSTTYFALADAYGDFYALWAKDPVITEALHAATITDANAKAVGKLLDDAAIRDTLVHSVYLINGSSDIVLSNLAWQQESRNYISMIFTEILDGGRGQHDHIDEIADFIGLSVGYLDSRYFYTLFKKESRHDHRRVSPVDPEGG